MLRQSGQWRACNSTHCSNVHTHSQLRGGLRLAALHRRPQVLCRSDLNGQHGVATLTPQALPTSTAQEQSQQRAQAAPPTPLDPVALHAEVLLLRHENQQLRAELDSLRSLVVLGSATSLTATEAVLTASTTVAGQGRAALAPAADQAFNPAEVLSRVQQLLDAGDYPSLAAVPVEDIQAALALDVAWPQSTSSPFWDHPARTSPFPLRLRDSLQVPVPQDTQQLHIVHVAAELAPIGKVGGLGDVVAGLSRATMARGHRVSVIMPLYECLDQKQIQSLKHEMDLEVPKGYVWDGEFRLGSLRTSVYSGLVGGVLVYFIRPADWDACRLFRGSKIYGGSYDDREAYLYLCRAALEYLKVSGQQPHIIAAHDWHTSAVPMLYWDVYHPEGMFRPRVTLTLHNLEASGECRQDEFAFAGISGTLFAQVDKALDERTIGHNPERLNLLKGGIIYSNAVTTVSPTYASDILNAGAGGFLKPIFNQDHVSSKFKGVLNGVDVTEWSPAEDPLLPANYSAELPAGKALCKAYLQQGLGMAVDASKPLVAVVSRLVNQKNPGLMADAALKCRDAGAQYVLLGSGGQDGRLRGMAASEFKDHPDVRILIMYSEQLSHLIYAAADIVLVPSNFEPCGLTQMLAMRYGALPCVRQTGGLADTVRDLDSWNGPEAERNGYTFQGTDTASMNSALDRAFALFKTQPDTWQMVSKRNMQVDVSWAKPAKEYTDLYRSIAQF